MRHRQFAALFATFLATATVVAQANPPPSPQPSTTNDSSPSPSSQPSTINHSSPSPSPQPSTINHYSPPPSPQPSPINHSPSSPSSPSSRLPPAAELMQGLMKRLPAQSVLLTGDLITTATEAEEKTKLGVGILLCYPTLARYTVMDAFGRDLEQLTVHRRGGPATFEYQTGNPLAAAPVPGLAKPVTGTALTWMDLTLAFLWWPDGRTIGITEVLGQPCYVVDAHAPAGGLAPYASVRLWVNTKASMMMQAEGYDALGDPVRRIAVKSFKKLNEEWMIKDLEIRDLTSGRTTILRVRDAQPVGTESKAP